MLHQQFGPLPLEGEAFVPQCLDRLLRILPVPEGRSHRLAGRTAQGAGNFLHPRHFAGNLPCQAPVLCGADLPVSAKAL